MAGCATPQLQQISDHPPADLAPRAAVAGVPFFAQEDYQCGPAALAMALAAGGASVTAQDLVPQVWLPGRKGSLQVEMLAAARRQGALALEVSPHLEDLLREVATGHPVIVLQNLGLDWHPVWHYAVAVGYDLPTGRILLRSGRTQSEDLPLSTFEHTWARSGRWAMLALRPGELPATTTEEAYLLAVARLETAGQAGPARTAYTAALKNWPDSLAALVGLGNAAYASGDLTAAAKAFRQASDAHPESVAALNNLAQALFELGSSSEAQAAAQRAVTLGGPLHSTALQTLAAIKAQATPLDPVLQGH